MLEKGWMDLRVYMEEMELGSKIWRVECYWNSVIRRIYEWQIHGLRRRRKGLSEVSMEIINASGKLGIDVMMKLCQRVRDEKGMPKDWKTSVIMPIYKRKIDVTNCNAYKNWNME